MSRRIIITIHDNTLTIGKAVKLLNDIDYDHSNNFERDCIWKMDTGHYIKVDISKLKTGIKFDVWKEGELV